MNTAKCDVAYNLLFYDHVHIIWIYHIHTRPLTIEYFDISLEIESFRSHTNSVVGCVSAAKLDGGGRP